jgi:adenosylmethionine-8-amino-7-oxononanoate aminotransferase
VAIKLALEYQVARGNSGRTRMLTVRGGYHSDTFAPMSVRDPVNGMHSLFTGALKEQVFGPQPTVR